MKRIQTVKARLEDKKTLVFKDKTIPLGNYVELLSRLVEKFPPGTELDIFVTHDDDCLIFEDKPCNCNPTVKIGYPDRMN